MNGLAPPTAPGCSMNRKECLWFVDARGYRLLPNLAEDPTTHRRWKRWKITLLDTTADPIDVPRRARCPLPETRDLWPAPVDPTTRLGRIRRLLLDALGPRCHACDRRPGQIIDHDHLSGLVRGLVCRHCNTALERCVHVSGCLWGDYLNNPPAWPLTI
jgi:hypothetical protein